MAKLSDFLGGLVSSISDARVNSDIQSIKIAQEYAKNDLLKHFVVPRMRVDKVEMTIPVAIDGLLESSQKIYEPIDGSLVFEKVQQEILVTFRLKSLSSNAAERLRGAITENLRALETRLGSNQAENALEDFSRNMADKVIELADIIFEDKREKPTEAQLVKFRQDIYDKLLAVLKAIVKLKSAETKLDSFHVIVEADKLREIRPDHIIMIKMTVSEQGMEWIRMENNNGELVTKLMPE